MSRRDRRSEELSGTQEHAVDGIHSGDETPAERGLKRPRRRSTKSTVAEEETRTKMTLSLGHEVAWRLRVLAEMQGTTPGRLIEPLIVPYLKQEALPYDRYCRKGPSSGPSSDGASAA